MRRIRLVVAALTIALVVPIALLVHRAVQSTALERELRHRTIAERIFDEMERALSDFLKQEEGRPSVGYAETEPSSPFVLAYFEIEPDGRVVVRGAPASGDKSAAVQGVKELLSAGDAEPRANAPAQVAGTTVRLAQEQQAKPAAPAALDDKEEQYEERERDVPAYDALRALNKGAMQRASAPEDEVGRRGVERAGWEDASSRVLGRRDADAHDDVSADVVVEALAAPAKSSRPRSSCRR